MPKLRRTSFAEKIHALADRVDREGLGFHDQMIRVANLLKSEGVDPVKAIDLMHSASNQVTRRKVRVGEIENVVGWVYQSNGMGGFKSYERPTQRVKRNQQTIDEWSARGSIKSLMDESDPVPEKPADIINDLFTSDALLHIAPTIFTDKIKSCSEWLKEDLTSMQYLCPCIFKGREKGRLAQNVDHRKYVVFETDEKPGDWDGQAGLIKRLSQELPCKMVVYSGNKSLHSWHIASTPMKDKIQRFHDLVVTLGGDRAVLRAAQMVRFPLGVNTKTNKVQKVIYFRYG